MGEKGYPRAHNEPARHANFDVHGLGEGRHQEERNEEKLFDRSNSLAVSGLGCGANLTQHTAVDNTGRKFATVHISIVHIAQPTTCGSR